jgi:hypothetical protein
MEIMKSNIADVSYYLEESILDDRSVSKATSVYLVDRVGTYVLKYCLILLVHLVEEKYTFQLFLK